MVFKELAQVRRRETDREVDRPRLLSRLRRFHPLRCKGRDGFQSEEVALQAPKEIGRVVTAGFFQPLLCGNIQLDGGRVREAIELLGELLHALGKVFDSRQEVLGRQRIAVELPIVVMGAQRCVRSQRQRTSACLSSWS